MVHMAVAIASIAVMVNLAIALPQTCLLVELHVPELDRISTHTYDVPVVEEQEVIPRDPYPYCALQRPAGPADDAQVDSTNLPVRGEDAPPRSASS